MFLREKRIYSVLSVFFGLLSDVDTVFKSIKALVKQSDMEICVTFTLFNHNWSCFGHLFLIILFYLSVFPFACWYSKSKVNVQNNDKERMSKTSLNQIF